MQFNFIYGLFLCTSQPSCQHCPRKENAGDQKMPQSGLWRSKGCYSLEYKIIFINLADVLFQLPLITKPSLTLRTEAILAEAAQTHGTNGEHHSAASPLFSLTSLGHAPILNNQSTKDSHNWVMCQVCDRIAWESSICSPSAVPSFWCWLNTINTSMTVKHQWDKKCNNAVTEPISWSLTLMEPSKTRERNS